MLLRRITLKTTQSYMGISALFLAVSFLWARSSKVYGGEVFWDGRVYAKAIYIYRMGGNPYFTSHLALPFVNPPFFLKAAAQLSYIFPSHSGWYVYLVALVLSTLAIPYILAKFYLQSEWLSPVLALLLYSTQPRFIVEQQTLNSGNIAAPLYSLILLAGVPGIRSNRWMWFYFAIMLASLTKPAYLSFLLLPLFAGERQFWRTVVTTSFVLAAYVFQRLALPELYISFKDAVQQQLFVKHDVGIGIYSCLYRLGDKLVLFRSGLVDISVHCAICIILLAGLFIVRRKSSPLEAGRLWIPALLVTAVLINPRMQNYDAATAIIPSLYLCVESVRFACKDISKLPYVAVAGTLLLFIFTTDYTVGICSLFLASITFAIYLVGHRSTQAFL